MQEVEAQVSCLEEVLYVHMQRGEGLDSEDLRLITMANEFHAIRILRSWVDEPIGYIIAAKVSFPTLKMLQITYGKLQYPHEWRSGKIVYICKAVFVEKQRSLAKRRLYELLKAYKIFSYYRKNRMTVKSIKNNISKSIDVSGLIRVKN